MTKFVPKEVVLDLIITNLQVRRVSDFSIIPSSTSPSAASKSSKLVGISFLETVEAVALITSM